MFWFRATSSASGEQWLLSQLGKSSDSNGLRVYRTGDRVYVQLGNFGLGKHITASAYPIAQGRWHHIAIRRHKRLIEVWLDGVLGSVSYEPSTYTQPLHAPKDFGDPITVGYRQKQHGGESNHFTGQFDDLLIFDRPITRQEIRVYARSRRPFGSKLLADARDDYADLRVTEEGIVHTKETHTHFDMSGLRPHGDAAKKGVYAYLPLGPNHKATIGKSGAIFGSTDAVTGRFGKPSSALRFNGGTLIQTTYTTRPSADATTVELFFKLAAGKTGKVGLIYMQRHAGIAVNVGTQARLYGELFFKDSPSSGIVLSGKTGLKIGRWYHAAVTYDGKHGRLFLDGRLEAQFSKSEKLAAASGIAHYYLGRRVNVYFKGTLDDVVVHNVARSPDWIARRARGLPTVRFLASTSPYVERFGAWRFNTYRFRWKMPSLIPKTTQLTAPNKTTKCDSVVSTCTGYAAFWRFEGEYLTDESAHRNPGLLKGAARLDSGRTGGGLSLDASTGTRGHVADGAGALRLDMYTVEASARLTNTFGKRCLVTKGAITGQNYALCINSSKYPSDTLMTRQNKGAGKDVFSTAITPLTKNRWHHFATTHESGKLSLFMDGRFLVSRSGAGKPNQDNQSVMLGYEAGAANHSKLSGRLDNVRIMSRALTEDELLHHPAAEPAD